MTRHRTLQYATIASQGICLSGLVLCSVLSLPAQQLAGAGTNGSRESSQPRTQITSNPSKKTTSTFIGYATNGSFFFPDIATSPGPLTTGGKFKLFVNQSISPPYVLAAALGAAINQARDTPAGYGQGWDTYGSRFGTNMARASSNSFFGTFLFPSLFLQDPRFFPESNPSLWRSLKYSTQRIVITRNDSGKDVFNTSGLLGPLASEGLANLYLPSSEQTAGKTVTRFAIDLAWRVGGNMFKDYWPTFFRNMGLNRLKVIPAPGKSRDSSKAK
ncbi:MAG TPA: hypothetical protein VF011_14975 [Terriglobales bacterium]